MGRHGEMHVATSAAASSAVLIGDGLLLLGIVLALAARLPFYSERKHDKWMTQVGLFTSCIGACAVLIGTDDELHLGHSLWKVVAFAVLILSAFVILLLLLVARRWFRACVMFILKPVRHLAGHVKNSSHTDQGQKAHEVGREQTLVPVEKGGQGPNSKEVREREHHRASCDGLTEPQAETNKPRGWRLRVSLGISWRHG